MEPGDLPPELIDLIYLYTDYKVFLETFGEDVFVLTLGLYEDYAKNQRQNIFEWAALKG